MNLSPSRNLTDEIFEGIDIPDSSYELAEKRYKDLGMWLSREDSRCHSYDPHIFPQGSFRLGTVIKPLDDKTEYDLDLACTFKSGVSKTIHTQAQVKTLIGGEVESYRLARKIEEGIEEKRRCWRLKYQDDLRFHLDVVPGIPEGENTQKTIRENMIKYGSDQTVAATISMLTVSITDKKHRNYSRICDDWNVSNPEGYAKWFESRMSLAKQLLEERVAFYKVASINKLPIFRWKTPLQKCIQVLKRHRDLWSASNPESKPISIIITTLAALAYDGESNTDDAIKNILNKMDALINGTKPRIPNPVNPNEDFADKWPTEEGLLLNLEKNFRLWIVQARSDFNSLFTSNDSNFITENVMKRFKVSVDRNKIGEYVGASGVSIAPKTKVHTFTKPASPWAE